MVEWKLERDAFPAVAGMSPPKGWISIQPESVPRSRGDEPVPIVRDSATKARSPQSRG